MKKTLFLLSLTLILLTSLNNTPNAKSKTVSYTIKLTDNQINITDRQINILRERFKNYGLHKVKFTHANNKLIIKFHVKNISDTADISQLITKPGKLEFLETEKTDADKELFLKVRNKLSEFLLKDSHRQNINVVFGYFNTEDKISVENIILSSEVQSLLPENDKFLFTKAERGEVQLLLIKSEGLSGDFIQNTEYKKDRTGIHALSVNLKPEYHAKWAKMTKDNINNNIAIIFDDVIISYPRVTDEIKGGKLIITGYNAQELKRTEAILNSEIMDGKFIIEEIKIL